MRGCTRPAMCAGTQKPTMSWAASKEVWAAGQGRGFCPTVPAGEAPPAVLHPALESSVPDKTDTNLVKPVQRRPPGLSGDGALLLGGKAERIGFLQPGK